KLVLATINQIQETFAGERSNLEQQWTRGDQISTEDLRLCSSGIDSSSIDCYLACSRSAICGINAIPPLKWRTVTACDLKDCNPHSGGLSQTVSEKSLPMRGKHSR